MFKVGDRVRVRDGTLPLDSGGHVGKITTEDSSVVDKAGMLYLVVFDDPADGPDQGNWDNWLSDMWFNDFELEAVDGSNT